MKWLLVAATLCIGFPAFAQQPDQSAVLQKALQAMQEQRDRVSGDLLNARTQSLLLADENTKLRAEIEELKKKIPADPPAQ